MSLAANVGVAHVVASYSNAILPSHRLGGCCFIRVEAAVTSLSPRLRAFARRRLVPIAALHGSYVGVTWALCLGRVVYAVPATLEPTHGRAWKRGPKKTSRWCG